MTLRVFAAVLSIIIITPFCHIQLMYRGVQPPPPLPQQHMEDAGERQAFQSHSGSQMASEKIE